MTDTIVPYVVQMEAETHNYQGNSTYEFHRHLVPCIVGDGGNSIARELALSSGKQVTINFILGPTHERH